MRARPLALAVATALALAPLAPQAASAQTAPALRAVGLTSTNQLVSFALDSPSNPSAGVAITGLPSGETIVGIDFRPANARLYGLSSAGRLYTLDAATGAATPVGSTAVSPALTGTGFGFDFNPVPDRIRVETTDDQNLRLHPDTGAQVDGDAATTGTQQDGTLAYATGDANAGTNPEIAASAYTNNTSGATSTTNYAIDTATDRLVTQGSVGGTPVSPNTGQLFTVGALGTDTTPAGTAFDIAPNGEAFATLTAPGATSSTLNRIDLTTGRATAVGTVTGLVLRGFAITVPDPVRRLAGADRITTAVAISANSFPTASSAESVVLARADVFADALSGTPLAVAKTAPVLLSESGALSAPTKTELQRVLAVGRTVHVLGGTAALASGIDTELTSLGYVVVRYAGTDRFDTSVRIARQGLADPANLLLATGLDFPAPIVAGPAAAKVTGAVILTAGRVLTPGTRDYLNSRSNATRFAVGSDAAAADQTARPVAAGTNDPYELSRQVAEQFFTGPVTTVGFASGVSFIDGLAGGAHIGRKGGPLLLVAPDSLPAPVRTYLEARKVTITSGFLYGGPAAVDEAVRTAAQLAIT